ncbi:hypothetical protein Peur_019885 [Populus x canadensis]
MERVVLRFLLASAVILTAATVISGERVNETSATADDYLSAGADVDDHDDLDGEFSSLDGVLRCAIGHSDPAKLKESAEDVQRLSASELQKRQLEIKDLLILVEPLDNANDLNKHGGLAIVIQEFNHPDPDIRRLSAWVLGKAYQNNPVVQKQILELGALTKLIKMVNSISIEEAIKALYAVSALIQNNLSGQELFYAEAGDTMLQVPKILSNSSSDIRLHRKAVFLVVDLVECQLENLARAESPFFRNCFFLKSVVDLTASTDLDLQEKALVAIKNLLQLKTTEALIFKDFCDLNGSLVRMRQQLLDLMASADHRDYAVDLENLRGEVELIFHEKLGKVNLSVHKHATMSDGHETDKNVEIWKIKKLIKALEAAQGNGTSMISLIMPPRDHISRVTKMLGDEFGTASNIQSRVNRQSVLGAITSAQQRLKLYNKVPPNGLVLYTGTVVTEDGKERKVTVDFEPFRPINASLYLRDNKFHMEALSELLESDDKFGFIVMDGNGTLFGTLSGNTREAKVLNVVDVSYGGENGFNQAIELSAEILSNVKFIQEKRLIGKYFEEVSQDTGKYVFGVDDTLKALEMGAVETLIAWESLDINRYQLKNSATGEIVIKHLNKEQGTNQDNFRDAETKAELEVQDKMPLLEWFANEYRRFGCTLEFVTNKSQEGSQFCRGIGGIGGILRYQLDMRSFDLSDGDVYDDSE